MRIDTISKELCLLITEDLPIPDLYSLLRTCRGLSRILTPRLLELGLRDVGELTALQWAAERGHKSLVLLAISNGAKVNKTTKRWPYSTALHLAAMSERPNRDIIRTLVSEGARIEAKDSFRETPLFRAVEAGRAQAIEELLIQGAIVRGRDRLAHIAARGGNVDCMRALAVAGIDYRKTDMSDRTILHEAFCSSAGLSTAKYLLEQEGGRMIVNAKAYDKSTALHLLMKSVYFESPIGRELFKTLMQCGADFRVKDYRGNMPAHILAMSNDVDSMAELIDAGYDISAKGGRRETVLHKAVYGRGTMLRYLLGLEGAKSILNAQNRYGRTPLHLAVRDGSREKVELLLRHGADVGAKDNCGKTPLEIAVIWRQSSVVRAFNNSGVNVNLEDMPRRCPLFFRRAHRGKGKNPRAGRNARKWDPGALLEAAESKDFVMEYQQERWAYRALGLDGRLAEESDSTDSSE